VFENQSLEIFKYPFHGWRKKKGLSKKQKKGLKKKLAQNKGSQRIPSWAKKATTLKKF
jgi:hypothetical protein